MRLVDGVEQGISGAIVRMANSATHPTGLAAIAQRLRAIREATGLNQATFCDVVGLTTQTWNNFERGYRRITIDQAIKVCAATGATLDYIYLNNVAGLPTQLLQNMRRKPGH